MMAMVVAGCVNLGMWMNGVVQAGLTKYEHEKCSNFERVFSYRKVRDIANYTSIFFASVVMVQEFVPYVPPPSLMEFINFGGYPYGAMVIGGVGLGPLLAIVVALKITEIFNQVISHGWQTNSTELTCGTPPSKKWNQSCYLVQTITSVALAITTTSPIFYGVVSLIYGYAFLKMSAEQWVQIDVSKTLANVTITVDQSGVVGRERVTDIAKVDFHYYFPILPLNQNLDDNCAVCREEGGNCHPFHNNHIFHLECITPWLQQQITGLEIANFSREVEERNGSRHVSYSTEIVKGTLPICPLCREQPEMITANLAATVGPPNNQDRVEVSFVD